MKYMLCLIAFSLGMLSNLQAQVTGTIADNVKVSPPETDLDAIPKRTWKLVIHTNLSKEENYQLMGETLLEQDYMIEKTISEFHLIRTFPQGYKKLGLDYILNLVARDSVVVLTGLMINSETDKVVSLPDYSRIENRGMNGSPLRESFHEMVRLARILADGGEIEYVSE